jgi:hypothetical protein
MTALSSTAIEKCLANINEIASENYINCRPVRIGRVCLLMGL